MIVPKFKEFTFYDSFAPYVGAINTDNVVRISPADVNTTIEFNTGVLLTILQPYADVLIALNRA